MSALTAWALNASLTLSTTPTPMPAYDGDPNLVTPGVLGFIAIILVAFATVFLLMDMNRRIRRTKYRTEIRERIAEEQNAAQADVSDREPTAPSTREGQPSATDPSTRIEFSDGDSSGTPRS